MAVSGRIGMVERVIVAIVSGRGGMRGSVMARGTASKGGIASWRRGRGEAGIKPRERGGREAKGSIVSGGEG